MGAGMYEIVNHVARGVLSLAADWEVTMMNAGKAVLLREPRSLDQDCGRISALGSADEVNYPERAVSG